VNERDYPAERVQRYVTALNDADLYAQLSTPADRERFARAVMAVADAETDPVYKSGYDTGRKHAGLSRAAENFPDELLMLRGLVATMRAVAEHGDLSDVRKLLAEHERDEQDAYAEAEEKSSRVAADATPDKASARETRLAQLLDTIRTHGGAWTSGRVMDLRRFTGGPTQRGTASGDLAELHRRGHLSQHGADNGRFYTLRRKDGHS
jgi:hypothetical protein